ncbi:hypothetical protein NO1_1771 [Candidatus Termititenax aidoneus]|uniref:Uncharacterized protein n=1 Tax=Termititenax aidoneus TaxID=2218524 RepID=A0A388TDQ6_TERA1|nr:hypothetical protein NO1_1771 [Candidatus Termititenax aidoneus]
MLKNLPQLKGEMGYSPESMLVFFNQAVYFSKDSLSLLSADVLNKLATNGITNTETVARIFSSLAVKKSDEERQQFISSVVKLNTDLQGFAAEVKKDSVENIEDMIKHYEINLWLAEPEKTQLLEEIKTHREDYLFNKDKWLLAILKFNELDGLIFDRQLSCLEKIVDNDLETRFGFTDVGPVNYAEQMKNFSTSVKDDQLDYLLEQRGAKSVVDLLKPEDKAKLNQHLGVDIEADLIEEGIEKYFFVDGMLRTIKDYAKAMIAEYDSLKFLTDKDLDKIAELFLKIVLAIPKETLNSFNVYTDNYAELFSKTLQSFGYTDIKTYVFDNTAGIVLADMEKIEAPEAQTLRGDYIKTAERIAVLKAQLANDQNNEELRVEITRLENENKSRMAEMEEMLRTAKNPQEVVAYRKAIEDMLKAGRKAGSINETEANEIMARVNQIVINYFLANSSELKNSILTADFSQTKLSPNASDNEKLEYFKKLIEDTYSLSKLIAAKNAEIEKEEQLKKKREELASLNIPKSIRNLISQIYGIDFENIDGAVAKTIAEKVSRNENPLGG